LKLFGKILELVKRWRAPIAGALLFLLLVLVFPFQSTIVPRWRLHVVDETGTQIAGINVTEHWQHYLLESEGHEEMVKTDGSGMVDFPERTIRASVASRLAHRVTSFAGRGTKARIDKYSSVVVWGNRDYEIGVAVAAAEAPPPSEIKVHRVP